MGIFDKLRSSSASVKSVAEIPLLVKENVALGVGMLSHSYWRSLQHYKAQASEDKTDTRVRLNGVATKEGMKSMIAELHRSFGLDSAGKGEWDDFDDEDHNDPDGGGVGRIWFFDDSGRSLPAGTEVYVLCVLMVSSPADMTIVLQIDRWQKFLELAHNKWL